MFAFIWPRSSKKLLVKRTTFNLILFRRPNLIWCEFSSVNAKSPPPRSVVADVCLNYVSSFKVIHNFWFQCYTHSSPHSQTTDRLTVGEYSPLSGLYHLKQEIVCEFVLSFNSEFHSRFVLKWMRLFSAGGYNILILSCLNSRCAHFATLCCHGTVALCVSVILFLNLWWRNENYSSSMRSIGEPSPFHS